MEYVDGLANGSPSLMTKVGQGQADTLVHDGHDSRQGDRQKSQDGDSRAKSVEELLEYLASNQSVLSNEAYDQLISIIREKPSLGRTNAQMEQASQVSERMGAVGSNATLFQAPQFSRPPYDTIRGESAKQTALLECPKSMVGRVIGKAGETIKALQQYTGAMIQIDQSTDPTRVTIAGSPQSLQLAISMVSDIIKGKFKGFAMLRQIATANEIAQQHGGMNGMASQPVYVQGYGFMPPTQPVSTSSGYPSTQGAVPREVENPRALFTMPSLHQHQQPVQFSGIQQQQQSQYLINGNHDVILAKLMQLASLEQQRDHVPQTAPSQPGDSFFPGNGIGQHMFFNPLGTSSRQSSDFLGDSGPATGIFTQVHGTKGDDSGGCTTQSLF